MSEEGNMSGLLSKEESKEEFWLVMECYTGIPVEEDIQNLNDLQREKVARFLEKHDGRVIGVNINLDEYRPTPLFCIRDVRDASRVFCDAILPPTADKDILRTLVRLIKLWNSNKPFVDRKKTLDEVFRLIDQLGGVFLFWY